MRLSSIVVPAAIVVSVLLSAGPARAAGIAVSTTTDEYGVGPDECSLREAVQAANSNMPFGGCTAGSGADEITLPTGTYGFTQSGAEPIGGNVAVRDLDVDGTLTIVGTGNPVIDANVLDRIFQLTSGDSLPSAGSPSPTGRRR